MALYEFKREDAEDFARALNKETRRRGDELQFKFCPYCEGHTRKSGKRDTWTFSINLRTGQFKCLRGSCGRAGNMLQLAADFADQFNLSEDVSRYLNINGRNDRFRRFARKPPMEPRPSAIEYLKSRGISEAVCKAYEITTKSDDDNVLVFPFKMPDGDLRFIKYRNTKHNGKGSKEWCEADCMPILFGMNKCDLNTDTLVITEGQIDSLSLTEAGIPNAVSVPTGKNGFTWVPHCYDFVSQFRRIIVFGDLEGGEISLYDQMVDRFRGRVWHVRECDYLGCKDANEILQKHGIDALTNAVEKAVPSKVIGLKRVADIKYKSLAEMPKMPTLIEPLDKLLSGGLFYGQLAVLTGRSGDGKSTFMSQLIAHALHQGVPTMVYSGELTEDAFRGTLDRQVAGPDNVTQTPKQDDWHITAKDEENINSLYGENLWLFSSEDAAAEIDLFEVIIAAIQQYGCKFICIDNLMSALTVRAAGELYNEQSNFVERLVRIARAYNVIIVLVAHPKKNVGDTFDNDYISGASEIVKKADYVMVYRRDPDNTDAEYRFLELTKHRNTGVLTTSNTRLVLGYDIPSKRIYDAKAKDYGTYGLDIIGNIEYQKSMGPLTYEDEPF